MKWRIELTTVSREIGQVGRDAVEPQRRFLVAAISSPNVFISHSCSVRVSGTAWRPADACAKAGYNQGAAPAFVRCWAFGVGRSSDNERRLAYRFLWRRLREAMRRRLNSLRLDS